MHRNRNYPNRKNGGDDFFFYEDIMNINCEIFPDIKLIAPFRFIRIKTKVCPAEEYFG